MEKMELSKAFGAYPTMVTPYDENGNVDYAAAEAMVEWYWNMGCDGIFASCQSSEIQCLSEDDRVKLADCVKKKADALAAADPSRAPMLIVASGHVSDDFDDQARELNRIAGTGVDAVILITNRMDIENTGDDAWIRDAERLIQTIPEHVMLGLYECPRPYKRLLTPKMLEWCLSTGRFRYIKDTCCDEAEIERRLAILNGTPLRLFNANAQTLLE
ncbi:MAG: dihydrodipicolinate synthase family protein, partial [Clostridia bacterium]|nr:dihydrodipicolinate synthase family protein [Clostridia bacterium]